MPIRLDNTPMVRQHAAQRLAGQVVRQLPVRAAEEELRRQQKRHRAEKPGQRPPRSQIRHRGAQQRATTMKGVQVLST
jgi:hypothetical protein